MKTPCRTRAARRSAATTVFVPPARFFWIVALPLVCLGPSLVPSSARAQDPVTVFILEADVRSEATDAEFERWVESEPELVSAAVARLLDVAADLVDAERSADADDNVDLASRLAEAHEPPAASELLAEYRSWDETARARRREAKALEAEAAAHREEGRLEEALRALVAADSLYALVPDTHARAVVQGSLGVVHWHRGDLGAVEEAYTHALELRRRVDDRLLEGNTLNGLGSVAFQQGRLDDAADRYRQAIELRLATGDRPGLATSLTYLGNVRLQQDRLVEAKNLYTRARSILEETGTPRQLVENLSSTGNLLARMGRFVEAREVYRRAIDVCEPAADCRFGPMLWLSLSNCELNSGQLGAADRALETAERLLQGSPDPEQQQRLHLDGSILSILLGEPDEAREHAIAAVRMGRESGSPARLCDALVNAGMIYNALGAPARALRSAEQAEELAAEMNDALRHRDALRIRAEASLHSGDLEEALGSFTQVRDEAEAIGARAEVAEAELGRGAALSRLERLEEARRSIRRAAHLMEELGLRANLWRAHLNLGDSFESSHPDSAAWHYDRALDRIEDRRRDLGGGAFRTGYQFADRGRAYEEVTRYYARLHEEHPHEGWMRRAFTTAERAKSRGLLQLLESAAAPADLGDAAEALLDSLYLVDVSTPEGRRRHAKFQERWTEMRREAMARRAEPGWLDRSPAGLDEIRRRLGPQELLLEYAVGDSATILWIVEENGARMTRLPGRAELRRRVQGLRALLSSPHGGGTALRSGARQLRRILIGPAEAELDRTERLILVPDDILHQLPFEVLLGEAETGDTQWGRQSWLGRQVSALYLPSSTIYLHLLDATESEGSDRYDLEILALGDPAYASLSPRPGEEREPLTALPFAAKEVSAIGELVDEDRRVVLVGEEASEARLKRTLAEHSPRILHLAAHGLIDPVEADRSCIALVADGVEDGYLHSLEILSLPHTPPLVVLSACESALGRLERGEGVVGLTRSFLAAGTSGVMASLWPVSDLSTSVLMQEFYGRLWDGSGSTTPARALRDAKLVLMDSEEWGHPFFWAPFVLTGTATQSW